MNRIINLLTVCRKAGKLIMGFDACKEALASKKARLILLASDISPKTEKEIRFFAGKAGVTTVKTNIRIEEFHAGTGKRAGVLCICDGGFAKKLIALTEEPGTL